MSILSDLREGLPGLEARSFLGVDAGDLHAAMRLASDDDVVATVAAASALKNMLDRIVTVGAGVIAERSARSRGQSGVAAVRGHRTPGGLVQELTGCTRAEAARAVRVGESLLDVGASDVVVSWREPLRRALLAGALTSAQHEAILRGLGEPPLDGVTDADGMREVWSMAATQLIDEASVAPVEELARRARQVRDVLDPTGAEERFAKKYEARSFRTWTDADGVHHGHIVFDDERYAWWESIISAALRPRRGGPRFVTDEEREAAQELIDDPRTNEQLAYDLLMDVVCAGAVAEAADVFGARQPGVRIIVVADSAGGGLARDAFGRMRVVGHLEDGGDALPGSVVDRAICSVGYVVVTVDTCGNPLDVGREKRLFTPKQRIALAIRDGGCRWRGCKAPASECEAHHIDSWAGDEGRTDVDCGILLCRFHHMMLHNRGWVIRREEKGVFVLHGPPGDPVELPSRSAVRWAWDPPPDRKRWRENSAA